MEMGPHALCRIKGTSACFKEFIPQVEVGLGGVEKFRCGAWIVWCGSIYV